MNRFVVWDCSRNLDGVITFCDNGDIWFGDDAVLLYPRVEDIGNGNRRVEWAHGDSMRLFPELDDDAVINLLNADCVSSSFIQAPLHGFVPDQGWKLHFSANSYMDYQRMLLVLIPELLRLGLNFKVVRPSAFHEFACGGGQDGKFFTIYLREGQKFIHLLSEQARQMLFEWSAIPVKELNLGGKVFGRYGAFRGNTVCINGVWVYDNKAVAVPAGIRPITLNDC